MSSAIEVRRPGGVIRIRLPAYGTMASYIVPMLKHVESMPPFTRENEAEGPYALVMAPTRDRAEQIYKDTKSVALNMDGDIKVVSICVGTLSFEQHAFPVHTGCKVLIATPLRLHDCLLRGYFSLNQCRFLVIEDADRMLNIGFGESVVRVLDALPVSIPHKEEEEPDENNNNNNKNYRLFVGNITPAVERLARNYPGWCPFVGAHTPPPVES